jgi:hypothetical protein
MTLKAIWNMTNPGLFNQPTLNMTNPGLVNRINVSLLSI